MLTMYSHYADNRNIKAKVSTQDNVDELEDKIITSIQLTWFTMY